MRGTSLPQKKGVTLPWSVAVRVVLTAKGKSVKDLAEDLHSSGYGYTRNYVSSIIYGRVISKELHRKISDMLGIPDDDFITVTEDNYADFLS